MQAELDSGPFHLASRKEGWCYDSDQFSFTEINRPHG